MLNYEFSQTKTTDLFHCSSLFIGVFMHKCASLTNGKEPTRATAATNECHLLQLDANRRHQVFVLPSRKFRKMFLHLDKFSISARLGRYSSLLVL